MELEQQQQVPDWQNDPLCGMTQEEYNEMYERIRAELMEELKHLVEEQTAQAAAGSGEKAPAEPKEKAC